MKFEGSQKASVFSFLRVFISCKITLNLFFFFGHLPIFPLGILLILNAILAAKSNIASLGLIAWTSLPNGMIPYTGNQKRYFHSKKQHWSLGTHIWVFTKDKNNSTTLINRMRNAENLMIEIFFPWGKNKNKKGNCSLNTYFFTCLQTHILLTK